MDRCCPECRWGLRSAIINREFQKRMDKRGGAPGSGVCAAAWGVVSRLEAAGKAETHPAMSEQLQWPRCLQSGKSPQS